MKGRKLICSNRLCSVRCNWVKFHVDDKIKVSFISPFFLWESRDVYAINPKGDYTLFTFQETGRIWNIALRIFDEAICLKIINFSEKSTLNSSSTFADEIKSVLLRKFSRSIFRTSPNDLTINYRLNEKRIRFWTSIDLFMFADHFFFAFFFSCVPRKFQFCFIQKSNVEKVC